jgi:hypothetical protein
MMGALLALLPTKDWIYGGIIVALLALGVYEKHHLLAQGEQHELAAVKLASDKLQKQTAIQTAELQAKATMAEQAYEKEVNSLNDMAPVSVRLCNNPSGRTVVSQAGTIKPGAQNPGAAAGNLQPVPTGNSSERDIGPMLSALADAADRESAIVREFQTRE